MTTTPENFTIQDDRARIAKTRAAMSAKGLDAKFVTDPSNRSWLTGYDGWSFYVHQGVVLAMQGAPLWWGRAMDANGAERTVFSRCDYVIGISYPPDCGERTISIRADRRTGRISCRFGQSRDQRSIRRAHLAR